MPQPPEDEALQRRRFPRQDVWLRCWVVDEQVRRYACVSELSAGGARVVTSAPPQVGVPLAITLLDMGDPHQEPVNRQGRVVWRVAGPAGRGGLIGIKFDQVDEELVKTRSSGN